MTSVDRKLSQIEKEEKELKEKEIKLEAEEKYLREHDMKNEREIERLERQKGHSWGEEESHGEHNFVPSFPLIPHHSIGNVPGPLEVHMMA